MKNRQSPSSESLLIKKLSNSFYSEMIDEIEKKIPIRKGCINPSCFCTGACQEIIGYRDKLPGEL